ERSIEPEFPAKDAPAAAETLRQLEDRTIVLYRPQGYRPTARELQGALDKTPTTTGDFLAQANLLVDRGKADEAIADYGHVLATDPKNAAGLAGRGLARVMKGDDPEAEKDLEAAGALEPKNLIVAHAR